MAETRLTLEEAKAAGITKAQALQTRKDRLDRLQRAVVQYVDEEQDKITKEVAALEDILKGRRAGAGAAGDAPAAAGKLAAADLAWFLRGF